MDEIEQAAHEFVRLSDDYSLEEKEKHLADLFRQQVRLHMQRDHFDIAAIRKERQDREPTYGDDMAKIASVTGGLDMGCGKMEESRCLYDLASKVKEGVIVEIGSWKGRSTVALALGSMAGNGVPVYSVDPHAHTPDIDIGAPWFSYGPWDLGDWMEAILRFELSEIVRPVCLFSDHFIPCFAISEQKIGLLWIDASHVYEPTRYECFGLIEYLTEDAPIVFDDYNVEGVHKVCDELEEMGWTIQPWGAKMAVAWQPAPKK